MWLHLLGVIQRPEIDVNSCVTFNLILSCHVYKFWYFASVFVVLLAPQCVHRIVIHVRLFVNMAIKKMKNGILFLYFLIKKIFFVLLFFVLAVGK